MSECSRQTQIIYLLVYYENRTHSTHKQKYMKIHINYQVLKLAMISLGNLVFTRDSRMLCVSLPSSGRLSVCHTRDLYQNGAS